MDADPQLVEPALEERRAVSEEERKAITRAVAHTRRRVHLLLRGVTPDEDLNPLRPLPDLLLEAHLARMALNKLEVQAGLVREQGGCMPAAFWDVVTKARTTLRLLERDVSEARRRAR